MQWGTAPTRMRKYPRPSTLEEAYAYITDLQNTVAIMAKDIEQILAGRIDTSNIREISGWLVDPNSLQSKDGDVGMSTEDTAADDVRFWAGSTDKDTAPWRVTESGKMTATGATIQSQDGYPKVVLDPDGNLLGAYLDANNYIQIIPDYGGAPAIEFWTAGDLRARLSTLLGGLEILGVSGQIDIDGTEDGIRMYGQVTFDDWDKISSVGDSQNLQQALNGKANAFSGSSGTVWVATSNGGPADTPITFSNGIRTT